MTVVVAAYNAEAHLEQACWSVLGQTHQALELIVVDDGSTDGTVDIMTRLAAADPRVRLIRQPNRGVAAARNAAIAAARGQFIAPLDADDLWDATKIARQLQRFEDCGPDTGVVYAWWAWIDADGRVLDRSPRWLVEGRALERLMEVNFTGCASVPMFRRACVDEAGGYDVSLRSRNSGGCEDWDLALRIAERHAVAVAPAILVGYRRLSGSMSTATDTMWRSQIAVTNAVAARQAIAPEVLRRSRSQFALHLAGVAFWSRDYVEAIRWGLRSRPSTHTLLVVPHVLRVLVGSLVVSLRGPVLRWPADNAVAGLALPEPLIPYDRIYASHSARAQATTGTRGVAAQVAGVLAAVAVVAGLHWENDGLWFQGDAPRHAATGLFYRDLVAALPSDPVGYALSYYARYPVIVPGAYPPLFHMLEGLAFHLVGPFPVVAKTLVWMFAVLAGVYTMLWGRRWIAPWAGWAGALVILLPGFVQFSNSVLLNVPATGLGLAALYHLRAFLDLGKGHDAGWCAGFAGAAVGSYFLAAIIVPVAMVWLPLARAGARARMKSLWLLPVVLIVGIASAAAVMPLHLARNMLSAERLINLVPWTFYANGIVGLVGGPWLALAVVGLAIALSVRTRRREALHLLLAVAAVIVTLVMLPGMDSRYALLLAPLVVLAGLLGGAALADLSGSWRGAAGVVALVVLLGLTGWQAAGTTVPRVSGLERAVQYVKQHGSRDAVLYSGAYDGVFGFYTLALDPGMERRVVLANKLLYRYQLNRRFTWEETAFVRSIDEVVAMVRHQSGCQWVVVEVGPEDRLPVSERLLRQALRGPDFELVASFPVTAGPVSRLELYRFSHPVDPVTSVDLEFPSFSDRVFTGVTPVSRDKD